MENLRFADLICEMLHEDYEEPTRPIQCQVTMKARARTVALEGENCGFIVSPVIGIAALDIRRILGILGIFYSTKGNCFKELGRRSDHDKDDFRLDNLGLKTLAPAEFDAFSQALLQKALGDFLQNVLEYANKQLAHMTTTPTLPKFESMRTACQLMIEALMKLVYDELGEPRPILHPSIYNGRTSLGSVDRVPVPTNEH